MTDATIMVVEDERIVALHLRQQLAKLGYRVLPPVARGADALRRIEDVRPDLVLMDIHIDGDFDGIETAARIPAELQIPVIYLTAHSDHATVERARTTKPYGYLLKPFSERELEIAVQMALERRRHEIRLRDQQDRLRHAQKMEALGRLSGGIAHDFNNILAIIMGNLDLVAEGRTDDGERREIIRDALRATERGAALTSQLLAHSRHRPLAPAIVATGELLTDFTKFITPALGETIVVELRVPTDIWATRVDAHELHGALLNLAVNAKDAMPAGGRITIAAVNRMLTEDAAAAMAAAAGEYVVISVTDTGCGMTKDVRSRVLEPFFTTKSPDRGSGLGLSMVYGFAVQSGGDMVIDSEAGRGTTIDLYLPKASNQKMALPVAPSGPAPMPEQRGGATILVVEDEDMLRNIVIRLARRLGYEIVDAADGPAALHILEGGRHIDLLMTDIVLPNGITGPALAVEARNRRPGLKVLYMLGYAHDDADPGGMTALDAPLLSKPFRAQELAAKLREMLGASPAPAPAIAARG